MRPIHHAVAAAGCALIAVVLSAGGGHAASSGPVFRPAQTLANADSGTEPRVSIGPGGQGWLITNVNTTATVYRTTDQGASWTPTPANLVGQTLPTIDVDIVTTHTGRIIATELDTAGLNFPIGYTDDGGKTWTASSGLGKLADQDRQWLAVGPDDPTTGQPRVYLLFHNLLSGSASHNMYVETSTDGGATFGAPIPTTLPGSQAWLDLQCADSGGPSGLAVNQKTGQVYAFFGTRSSVVGGCGASVTGPFEINVVGATKVWVVSSPDGSAGSWTQSSPVDDSAAGNIVGMQLQGGALDTAGNVYVAYPESPGVYPDYSGAAIRVRWAPPDMSHWSAPITVAPQAQPGNVLAHIVAGDPGKFDVAYFAGVARAGSTPLWYETVGQVLDGMSASPAVTTTRLSSVPTYSGTASILMGACGSGPTQGVQNGFACNRSTDVWGVALDSSCNLYVTWPSVKETDTPGSVGATWVTNQTGGTTLCARSSLPGPAAAPLPKSLGGTGLANTAGAVAGGGMAAAAESGLLGLVGLRRTRRGRGGWRRTSRSIPEHREG